MNNVTQMDFSYLAGFMDGEGSFSIVRQKRSESLSGFRYSAYCEVGNTNLDVIEWVCNKFDARIRSQRHREPRYKVLYVAYFRPNLLRKILPNLIPLLKIKPRQATLVLELLEYNEERSSYSFNKDQIKHELWLKLRKLNERGLKNGELPEFKELRPNRLYKSKRICSIEFCSKKYYAKEYCKNHYRNLIQYPKSKLIQGGQNESKSKIN